MQSRTRRRHMQGEDANLLFRIKTYQVAAAGRGVVSPGRTSTLAQAGSKIIVSHHLVDLNLARFFLLASPPHRARLPHARML